MNIRPVLFICGFFVIILGIYQFIPIIYALLNGENANPFILSSAMSIFLGLLLSISTYEKIERINLKQTFLLTTITWFLASILSAIPLYLYPNLNLSFTDSIFETASGLTTTGATILSGLDNMPKTILLWRVALNWLGGIGIIVLCIGVLPFLKVGGMQLFQAESSDKSEKIFAKTKQIVISTLIIYLVLSFLCSTSFYLAGMSIFDAICHMMSCVSTAGFANYDASFGHFESKPLIQWIASFFMLTSSLPLVIYLFIYLGKWQKIKEDGQTKHFLIMILIFCLSITLYVYFKGGENNFESSLRKSVFMVTTIFSSTGYTINDYQLWGNIFQPLVLLMMAIGGCSGSTAGGIKFFRIKILFLCILSYFKKISDPNRVVILKYAGRNIQENEVLGILVYMALFMISLVVLTLILSLSGLDSITSISGVITCLGNYGPGLGDIIGPSGNFIKIPDIAKWALSLAMILGRLELVTVFVLFSPNTWKS